MKKINLNNRQPKVVRDESKFMVFADLMICLSLSLVLLRAMLAQGWLQIISLDFHSYRLPVDISWIKMSAINFLYFSSKHSKKSELSLTYYFLLQQGVWIWGKPVDGFTPDGDPIKVLVLDTEGLGATDEEQNHDVRIFSLAILLASYFIYNSQQSIDETKLNDLSLVINLTKNIQIKAGGGNDDADPDEYAQYFPTLMWVVRDFTLQLVDADSEPITSKDYLEKALQNQKGFSEAIDKKNRIRRLLKSFFKERDCCTMIRPLTNETELQNLANIPMDDLRPEFVEQAHTLRRKVMNRIKPKQLNNKPLNGEMLYNLAKSYVDSINAGAVPSIESSWSYICKNECQKAMMDAYQIFEKQFYDDFSERCPMLEGELKQIYKEAKAQAMVAFQKTAVGEVKDMFHTQLKQQM